MADQILNDAGYVLEEREKAINADRQVFLVNEAQCTRLWENLREVYKAFNSYSLGMQQICLPLFKRFYMLVMQADAIQGKCSCEQSWLEGAILYGDNPQLFKELSLDLQSCIPVSKAKVAIHDDVADEDFYKDIANLMAKLEELLNHSISGENEEHLARYLIEREKSRLLPDREDSNLDRPRVERFYEVHRHDPVLLEDLGMGAFGVVSKVEWLGLTCAMKEFPGVEPTNVKAVEAFVKEARTLVALNHPRIVKLLCTSSVDSEPSFMMELMPMSLSDFIKERKDNGVSGKMLFDIDPTIEMMLQIALGMRYLHEQGVVHRDLNSSNILVAPSIHEKLRTEGYADIKLTDFGLAKMKVDVLMKPTIKMLKMTRHIAPEAVNPLPSQRIDWRKVDTYNFGITCLEILGSELPNNEVLALPSNFPTNIGNHLKRCIAQNPREHPFFDKIVDTLDQVRLRPMPPMPQRRLPSLDDYKECASELKPKAMDSPIYYASGAIPLEPPMPLRSTEPRRFAYYQESRYAPRSRPRPMDSLIYYRGYVYDGILVSPLILFSLILVIGTGNMAIIMIILLPLILLVLLGPIREKFGKWWKELGRCWKKFGRYWRKFWSFCSKMQTGVQKDIFNKLDMVEVLCWNMKGHLKKVQVCHIECENLFQQYRRGVQKVRLAYKMAFENIKLWHLYPSKRLRQYREWILY